jgi:hypothetical protein
MTDDIERHLREALRDTDLPPAPPAVHMTIERLRAGSAVSEGRRPSARFTTRAGWTAAVMVLVVATALAVAMRNGSAIGPSPSGGAAPSIPAVSPSHSTAPSHSGPGVTDADLSMTFELDRTTVEPGGTVTGRVRVVNSRSTPVQYSVDYCGAAATMITRLPSPLDPSGRTWSGIADQLKTFALAGGGGGSNPNEPVWVYGAAEHCRPSDAYGRPVGMAPGEVIELTLVWKAEIVPGVPALPGNVPFTVTFAHDPSERPPAPSPATNGPVGSWIQTWEQLSISGVIRIDGHRPDLVTAGEALDALLDDSGFVAWLDEQPATTWGNTNLFLVNHGKAEGIMPPGPAWEIDLFREIGVPRNWAIGFVDAFTGKLISVTYCNNPCRT